MQNITLTQDDIQVLVSIMKTNAQLSATINSMDQNSRALALAQITNNSNFMQSFLTDRADDITADE